MNNSYYLEPARDFSSSRSISAEGITSGDSYYVITIKYLFNWQIIPLCEAWYKVRRLANFVKTDRDSWHSLATLAILAGCRESIVSRSPIVDSSWGSTEIGAAAQPLPTARIHGKHQCLPLGNYSRFHNDGRVWIFVVYTFCLYRIVIDLEFCCLALARRDYFYRNLPFLVVPPSQTK